MMKTFFLLTVFALSSLNQVQDSKPANTIPVDDEIRAGKALQVSFFNLNKVGDQRSVQIEAYLQKVVDKLAPFTKRKLKFTVHLDPNPAFRSAVAYPGGHIIVGGGVLAMMSTEDQLAVVLGHEMSHVDLGQCLQRLSDSMVKDHLTADQFDKLSIIDFGKPYGKDGELAADREGIELVQAAGYAPHAAIELLEMFQFLTRNAKTTPPRKDAPSLDERIQQARELIKSHGWSEAVSETPYPLP